MTQTEFTSAGRSLHARILKSLYDKRCEYRGFAYTHNHATTITTTIYTLQKFANK